MSPNFSCNGLCLFLSLKVVWSQALNLIPGCWAFMQLHWRGIAIQGSTKHTDTGTLCVLFHDFNKLENWNGATHRDYYLEEVLDWLKGSNLGISIIKINDSPHIKKLRTLPYAGSESQHYQWKRLQR